MPTGSSHQQAYDLVVLGSGPAGEKGAAQAATFGKRVAVVERQPFLGGAGANTGTLPSKTLRETALTLSGFRARNLYGVDLSLRREATVRDFLHREEVVTREARERVGGNLARNDIDIHHGEGSFVDPHTIEVRAADGKVTRLRGKTILIATGSSPVQPEIFPFAHRRVWDSDEVVRLDLMPRTMAVVGGGVIGSEYACTFAALGVEVTLIDGREEFLPFLDGEIARSLRTRMARLGVEFLTPERVTSCDASRDRVTLGLSSGANLVVDALLVAAGRQSNTGHLNLAAAGLAPGKRGLLEVNQHFQTSVPHIYAAGDVIGFPALASTSIEQGRLAAVHAFDLAYGRQMAPTLPHGLYTIPEISMVGNNEEELRQQGIDYVAGRASYAENARGAIIGDSDGFLKLLFRRDDLRLLGVHIIGESATEVVHVGLIALTSGATADLFINTCFNYPTLGDLYKSATYDALERRRRETDATASGERSP